MIIYYIKNKINNKMYIGQTVYSLKRRIKGHLQCVRLGRDRKLYNAIKKYGWDNFEYGIICNCQTLEELNQKETEYIVKFDTYKNGYNMGLGGDNNVMITEQTKKKHDEKMRTPEVRNKISQTMTKLRKEKGFSQETRQKISNKLKGNTNYKFHVFPMGTPVRCVSQDGTTIKEFKNRKSGSEWWKENGNTKGQAKRMREINKSIQNKEFIKGIRWEIIERS